MAKDDYHVIVYQILAYLYQCLKKGEDVNVRQLGVDSDYFKANGQQINRSYWAYIIYNLQNAGFITGVIFADIDNLRTPYPIRLDDCMITPRGIEYLTDNSFLKKAMDFLKDAKAIIPFP